MTEERLIEEIQRKLDFDMKRIRDWTIEDILYGYGFPMNTIEEIKEACTLIFRACYRICEPYEDKWLNKVGFFWVCHTRKYNRTIIIPKEELIELTFGELAKIYKMPLVTKINLEWLFYIILKELEMIKSSQKWSYWGKPILRNHSLQEIKNFTLYHIASEQNVDIREVKDLWWIIENIKEENEDFFYLEHDSFLKWIMDKIDGYFCRRKPKYGRVINKDNMVYICLTPLKDLAKIYHWPILTRRNLSSFLEGFYLEKEDENINY